MKKGKIKRLFGKIGMIMASFAFVFCSQMIIVSAEEPNEENEEFSEISEDIFMDLPVEETDETISLEEYIDYEVDMCQTPVYYSSSFAGDKLTGINRIIYEKAKIMMADVANGERESTVCNFSAEELGIGGQYSASDLGVSAVVSGGTITNEAQKAIKSKSGLDQLDTKAIFSALRYDCPYEKYWMGLSLMPSQSLCLSANYTSGEYKLMITGEMNFSFSVSADYKGSGEYKVDTAKTGAVKNTVSKINEILNSAQNLSDREKIDYYKNQISELTDYHDDAPNWDNSRYGDPWQLVYVFDGDPSTQVVCEGYSKAFMYLCNKSQFSDSSINCYIATGYMNGGGHMWNIIHWSDNINYMVDVTNADANDSDDFYMVLPKSGNVNSGYYFTNWNILYVYDDSAKKSFSEKELTIGSQTYGNLSNIFVNYDANIHAGNNTVFTVIREGGSDSCQFKLEYVIDSNGTAIVNDNGFVNSNVFNVTFPAKGKYELKFVANDSNTIVNEIVTVEVKENNGNNNDNPVSNDARQQVEAFVGRFYDEVLGRDAGPTEIKYWADILVNKEQTGAEVAAGFVHSPEFMNANYTDDVIVEKLYYAFFGRKPDEGGYKHWMDKMIDGYTLDQVLSGFTDSGEFRDLCKKYGINPGELGIEQGYPLGEARALKFGSKDNLDESKVEGYVVRMYQKALGRSCGQDEIDYWKNSIMTGAAPSGKPYDPASVASDGFLNSAEYIQKNKTDEEFVYDCYQAFFDRTPGTVETDYWVNRMKNRGYSRKRVVLEGFGTSNEFQNLLKSYGFEVLGW